MGDGFWRGVWTILIILGAFYLGGRGATNSIAGDCRRAGSFEDMHRKAFDCKERNCE